MPPPLSATRPTFDVGDVDVELAELLAGLLDALVDRLHDLPRVLLHPAEHTHTAVQTHVHTFKTCQRQIYLCSPFQT